MAPSSDVNDTRKIRQMMLTHCLFPKTSLG